MAQLAKPGMRDEDLRDSLAALARAGAGSPAVMLRELRRLRWVIDTYGRLVEEAGPRRARVIDAARLAAEQGLFAPDQVVALEREAPFDEVALEVFLRLARIKAEQGVDVLAPFVFELAARGLQTGTAQWQHSLPTDGDDDDQVDGQGRAA